MRFLSMILLRCALGVDELVSWRVGELVDWWVGGLVGWWVGVGVGVGIGRLTPTLPYLISAAFAVAILLLACSLSPGTRPLKWPPLPLTDPIPEPLGGGRAL